MDGTSKQEAMSSKGLRSKLDHESRTKRQKAIDQQREPPRPKVHWDHVIEEMVWLAKDFESERKWKLSQAKKVAIRASKSIVDQALKGERKVKEEEQRMRKIALNISKEVKKFWMKIEKLVLYKYQLESEERKKKALDKQLDFLLGQTERYSTMLAENLVDIPCSRKSAVDSGTVQQINMNSEDDEVCPPRIPIGQGSPLDHMEIDNEYGGQSEDDLADDEHTIEEDEAHFTEVERREELAALQAEADLPLEQLLEMYTNNGVSRLANPTVGEHSPMKSTEREDSSKDSLNQVNGLFNIQRSSDLPCEVSSSIDQITMKSQEAHTSMQERCVDANGECHCTSSNLNVKILHELELLSNGVDDLEQKSLALTGDELNDEDYFLIAEEKDDEATLSEEEELAKREATDPLEEIKQLQQESELPIEELLRRYGKVVEDDDDGSTKIGCAVSGLDNTLENDTEHNTQMGTSIYCMDSCELEHEKSGENNHFSDSEDKEAVNYRDDKILDKRESENIIADAAAAARSAQPTGNTFSTTKVRTKFPFLLKHPLREYQHIGLDWLVTMYDKRLNGILADEMGLGKTIMTIALLAHLACEMGIWGPHLIVVPTSVMLNWETEFLKWCPAFKILTYFGSAKERKQKRQGWLKPNSFHVCITTYRLILQDSKVFKRKKWKYLILDEAHLIKNWKSQRWQTLLNFNSKRRILLTGTPLQNDLMELWSLMHFLMPHIFQSHQEFKDWFSNPISGMVEGQEKVNREVVDRLHNVLRPFILRRLKRDVEKQLPRKHEHVIYCRLSRRQRNLYEDFITSSETQATLAGSNFFGMISVIMQLRKVCNHPDLFEGRPIISSYDMAGINEQLSSIVCSIFSHDPFSEVNLKGLNLAFTYQELNMASWEYEEILSIFSSSLIEQKMVEYMCTPYAGQNNHGSVLGNNLFEEIQKALFEERLKEYKERAASIAWWNYLNCQKKPMYGINLRKLVTIKHPVADILEQKNDPSCYMEFSSYLGNLVLSPVERLQKMIDTVESFMFAIPAARSPPPICWCSKGGSPVFLSSDYVDRCTEIFSPLLLPIRPAIVRRQVYFPDRRLIQFDCGKLQELAILLRRLKSEGHRALIFTQMTKMLDILEAFINLYGYTYMRLDGSTQPEERQTLMQRFNTNPKFFLFILSTRSGGVGINLVGADTVIFYDSDWNPAMDQQAQDRCHRIGQTREVHIYRLISVSTIEENILKKANQKRMLDDLVIQSGSYNTEFFKKLDPVELFSGHKSLHVGNFYKDDSLAESINNEMDIDISNADVEAAIKQAEDEADYMALKRVEQEEAVDNQEFSEDAIGRMDDDENEDEIKPDEKDTEEQKFYCNNMGINENDAIVCNENLEDERALTLIGMDEDVDMLADVKQMAAAAAAAGQASSTFENHLRPIDRYAMRFMDLWDPIIDKSAMEYPESVEEEDWELDRIEKFKEDLEAEIDEDQEPLLYESWDADFATTAYRQHVEALAQQQLLEEKEYEANADDADESLEANGNRFTERKPKSKKKKKTKFKSLKKGRLASEAEFLLDEQPVDLLSDDERNVSSDIISAASPLHPFALKKRKKAAVVADEKDLQNPKKPRKAPGNKFIGESNSLVTQIQESRELKFGDGANTFDDKSANRSKMGGKVSITVMPLKRIMVVKPEKFKRKGHVWSKDYFPPTDSWSTQEDAVLCAVVHEYGTNWSLASDVIYSVSCGGFYRGLFRHPVHCCERFRELFFKYVQSTTDNSNSEKNFATGSGKSLLKVTEEHVHYLLNITSDIPNNELLLQKHFVAILSSVWRKKCRLERCPTILSSQSGSYINFSSYSSMRKTGVDQPKERHNKKLVMTALNDLDVRQLERIKASSMQDAPVEIDQLELTLDLSSAKTAYFDNTFPSTVNVSLQVIEQQKSAEQHGSSFLSESSCRIAEDRFRQTSEICLEGECSGWVTIGFPSCYASRSRCAGKSQSHGKLKFFSEPWRFSKSRVPRTMDSQEESALATKFHLSSANHIIEFDNLALVDLNYGNDDPFNTPTLEDMQTLGCVPHEYDPDFLKDLQDLDSDIDITDIG
ncbi:hypothetical protein HPP92_024595 [Vanilla planifolia]|uniref:DNA helicase n=1 Tax=Vanilla planifolia TaxID=51239 RepID=A0A835UBM5_VANPL|nr:hypothetical protein HPP92_024595 [Vanilla planifolia]